MNNIKTIINQHNKKKTLRQNSEYNKEKLCNCRTKNFFQLNNKCLQNSVVYRTTIKSDHDVKTYIGSTGNTFKARWYGHNSDFKNTNKDGTELCKHIWN